MAMLLSMIRFIIMTGNKILNNRTNFFKLLHKMITKISYDRKQTHAIKFGKPKNIFLAISEVWDLMWRSWELRKDRGTVKLRPD